jgi:hypothetical protein
MRRASVENPGVAQPGAWFGIKPSIGIPRIFNRIASPKVDEITVVHTELGAHYAKDYARTIELASFAPVHLSNFAASLELHLDFDCFPVWQENS